MTPIIDIQGLRKVYPGSEGTEVVAVDDLDLSVGLPGTVHGFLGPNGSGKTTTIRCLLSLIRPTAGTVRVFGVDTSTQFHQVASRVGAIVENPKMFPNFSGRRNLSLLADLAGIPKGEVDRVLGVVGLAERHGDSFDSYSLGMKQRLAIAAALLKDPDLLILDEPANGLDPAGIAEMRVLIRGIADQGKAVLVSSHQLSEVEQVCDDVTIINRGRLVTTGTVDEVRRHAGDDEIVVTIASRDRAVQVLSAGGLAAHPRPTADELTVVVDVAQASEVTRLLADNDLYLSGLRTERATLEQAFLNLTGGPPPPTGPPPGAGALPPPTPVSGGAS
ncbi:MAG: ABC transporter ATP-binding protein [Actinomycetia bacterium]|nr:ABC transporter ATP-binding protein [Actinomycetes bacterium]